MKKYKNFKGAMTDIKTIQDKLFQMRERHGKKVNHKNRAEPGEKGSGKYFRIVVQSKSAFAVFRCVDVGRGGSIKRLIGRKEGSFYWHTQTWLISKDDALKKNKSLEPITKNAKDLLESLNAKLTHIKGDIFKAEFRKTNSRRFLNHSL